MKIIIVASDTKSLVDFRGDLLITLISKGHSLVTLSPELGYDSFFSENNIKFHKINLNRAKISIFGDYKYYRQIKRIIQDENPDLLFSYSMKPVIYSSFAARKKTSLDVYSLLPGLGMTFSKPKQIKNKLVQLITKMMLKKALKINRIVIVQNSDDLEELVEKKICDRHKIVRVNSSGVNMNKYILSPLPKEIVFLMASRLLKSKGVIEYCNAARIIHNNYPHVKFILAGNIDSNSDSLSEHQLKEISESGIVDYRGNVDNIIEVLKESSVFVLPSYYREGVPRSIQEAMSMGRPIITTNWIGCRDTVIEGYNGYLIEPKDCIVLARAMKKFILNPQLIKTFGVNSYNLCKDKFEISVVNSQMLKFLNIK